MSENSTFIPKKTASRTPKTVVRRHIPEAQSRVTVPTVRIQRESGARALGPSPSTTRSGYLGRDNMSLVTGETSLLASMARRNIVTSGRVHSSAAPPLLPTGTARAARMPAVANAASGIRLSAGTARAARMPAVANAASGVRAREMPAGRGGRVSVRSSAVGLRTRGLISTSSLQNVPPRRSLRLQVLSSVTPKKEEAEETCTTPPPLKRQSSFGRSSPGENVFYCPICYENIKNIGGRTVVLPCGHVFCRGCLFACFQTKRICPLCQVAFNDPQNIIEIFL